MERGKLIGFTGLAGSGKTTARNALESVGWKNVKMAAALKDMARVLFCAAGLDPEECVEGKLKEESLQELFGKSPRYVMQTLGSEWGRDCINHDIWVNLAKKQCLDLMDKGINVVIDDVRFDNEAEMIRSIGGKVVLLKGRGGISGSHVSENGTHPDLAINNLGSIDQFKRDVIYILHDEHYPE